MLSIITPNLNNGQYLEDNILSIQKLKIPFEHIIVDGGSTDNSLEIIAKYPHITLLHQTEKNGMYGAIDQGFKSAQGEYICWINADDRAIAEGIEKMMSATEKESYDFIYSDSEYFFIKTGQRKSVKGRRFGKFFLQHGLIPAIQPSIIFSKKIYNQIGGFRFDKFRIAGDLDLFVRIAKEENSKFKYIPVRSSTFIKRGDSLGDLNHDKYLQELKGNKIPKPNIFVRLAFFISKLI